MSVEDTLFRQARSLKGAELQDFNVGLTSLLKSSDRGGSDLLSTMRQLYVILEVTRRNIRLPDDLFKELYSTLIEPEKGSSRSRLLCCVILRELAPSPRICIEGLSPPVELKYVQFLLPLILAQGMKFGRVKKTLSQILVWITQPGSDLELCVRGLPWLAQVCTDRPDLLTQDQYSGVSRQMASWLKKASTVSAQNPFAGRSLFSASRSAPVKEIDGSSLRDFFTILNYGQFFSHDQLLNIQSFSMLRRWIRAGSTDGLGEASSRSRAGSEEAPPSSTSGTVLGIVRTRYQLKETAVEYCLNVIDQCEKKPVKPFDEELINACLYEAVATLDQLCQLDKSLVTRLFPTVRKLFSRMGSAFTPAKSRLLTVVFLFLLRHGEDTVHILEPACTALFGACVATHFTSCSVSFDIVQLCRQNAAKLRRSTNVFTKYFPNLLKIFAWAPRTYLFDFAEILPYMITPNTALEVLHSLFDLPCLSAALEAENRTLQLDKRSADFGTQSGVGLSSAAAVQQQQNKPLLWFILRQEGGKGDTIDRLSLLHDLLDDLKSHPRVQYCAEGSTILMRLFFKTILAQGDYSVISRVLPVTMERLGQLYGISSFQKEVRVILADELLLMFKAFPALIVDHVGDITEYTGSLRNMMDGKEHYFVHIIWIVGEYAASHYDSRCSTEVLVKYHESLECVAYELSMVLQSTSAVKQGGANMTRLMSVLMTALAKVASRCQDLIPRVLLCLTKIVKQHAESQVDRASRQVMLSRASELVNVLKMPSLAATILSAMSEDLDLARKQSIDGDREIALFLQTTSSLVQH